MLAEYLTVTDALSRILAAIEPLPATTVPLPQSLGRILAQPIIAEDNLPPFANSAMDGYAVIAADTAQPPIRLTVVGEIPAGAAPEIPLQRGEAARITTGAPMPSGSDAVVPVEDTDEPWQDVDRPLPASIEIRRQVKSGDYVRQAGGDVQKGQMVMPAGRLIRPAEIGALASLGFAQVPVIRQPKVAILATGDELIPVERPLRPGKIRNSNSYTQAAQLAQLGAAPVSLGVARDTEADVRDKLWTGVEAGVDLFISSAGVSVGAYDVVKTVLEKEGNIGFWRVRMRPGKPLAFGSYAGIPYLGLPGNPVSAAVSFERFVRPAVLKLSGHSQLDRPQVMAETTHNLQSDGRESYVRAKISRQGDRYVATPTGGQGSHMITSLVNANGLLIVPEGVRQVNAGHQLAALMIDWNSAVF